MNEEEGRAGTLGVDGGGGGGMIGALGKSGKLREGGGLEEGGDGEVRAEAFFQLGEDADGGEGGAAQLEEVVVAVDGVNGEDFAPHFGPGTLEFSRCSAAGCRGRGGDF